MTTATAPSDRDTPATLWFLIAQAGHLGCGGWTLGDDGRLLRACGTACWGTSSRTQPGTGSNAELDVLQLAYTWRVPGPSDRTVCGPLRAVKGACGGAARWLSATLDSSSRSNDRLVIGRTRTSDARPLHCSLYGAMQMSLYADTALYTCQESGGGAGHGRPQAPPGTLPAERSPG